jgi:hypothetical protein
MATSERCGARPNPDTKLLPCDRPKGHGEWHGCGDYVWKESALLGPLLPVPAAWEPPRAAFPSDTEAGR